MDQNISLKMNERIGLLDDLIQCIEIPSVSTDSSYEKDMQRCSDYIKTYLNRIGFENIQNLNGGGYSAIYADWMHQKGKPTVLIYGHYDVQPAESLEGWLSHPFQPEIRDGYLYGRGATDNKGQLFMQLKALETLFKQNNVLPVNVKLIIEGEEEIGSKTMPEIIDKYKSLLSADLLVVSDTASIKKEAPAICHGLRGMIGFELTVLGPNRDLHSGSIYGGVVQNPIYALVHILNSMKNDQGYITIPKFYEDVKRLTDVEKEALESISFSEDKLIEDIGVTQLFGEKGYSFLERVWTRPTLEVNGIEGGYQGEGVKSIIPAKAKAKVTCRIVPNQNAEQLKSMIDQHIRENTPVGVKVDIEWNKCSDPFFIQPDHPYILKALSSLQSVFDKPVQLIRAGGTIAAVEMMNRALGIPAILIGFGFGHSTSNVHSINENMSVEKFEKAIAALSNYYLSLGKGNVEQ
ncbi:dipeptidase [Chengkuizengella axinellae]|uniref:Dipeptidase n=1 Tax=Chengkuizengella axinellae TaxID=3064388 RepID=A0ABT9J313_9BACL|nr:dipeptidase [Chengkuizengella sp. 2205SS18-9]MDP5275384.1 dipeptidase [Chengkuizengella sp. 2205SS18-9]